MKNHKIYVLVVIIMVLVSNCFVDSKSTISAATKSKKTFVVCIDAGHQRKANLKKEPLGPNSKILKYKVAGGTTGVVTKKPEYVLTLEASLILKDILEKQGVKVVMTRTSHDVNISNKERAEIANKNNVDLFVRIHADGSVNKNERGFSILVPSKNNGFTKGIFERSNSAGQFILNSVSSDKGVVVKGISYRDDMTGFNWSKVPVVLPELGFMTNSQEDKNLSNANYMKTLMVDVSNGIINYLNSNK